MSETSTEVTETVTEEPTTEVTETATTEDKTKPGDITDQLPDDHPLVKALAAQKTQIKELKTKAARLDAIEEAQKTELQKAVERAEAAEGVAYALKAAQEISDWKAKVSKDTGVPIDVLRGSDLDEIQAHAASLKAAFPQPKPGSVPAEGRTVTPGTGEPAQQFAELIRNARKG